MEKIKNATGSFFKSTFYNKAAFFDAAVFLVTAALCLLFMGQSDINVTGDRSFLFFESGIFNFYDLSHQATGGYGANYLPSTFWLFAVWNILPRILGANPGAIGHTPHTLLTVWYKLLPVIFYIACGILVFAILKQLGCNEKKARIGMYLFLTSPVAMFSQFIFCQYDSFTVFFVLLGILLYLRDNNIGFALAMGFAATFKYYAFAIFVIFIFLKEKRIPRLILWLALGALPFAAETLMYIGNESFIQSVFKFSALSYVNNMSFGVGYADIQLVPFAGLLICAAAYFIKPKNKKDLFCTAVYLSLGICFVLFGMSAFHPQWLLFAVPFWVFAQLMYTKQPVFFWLDMLFFAVLALFIANMPSWYGNVDSAMFKSGLLGSLLTNLPQEGYKHLSDFIHYENVNLMYTVMSVLQLLMFALRSPKNADADINAMPQAGKALLRARMATVFIFIIPMLLCLPSMLRAVR